MATLATVTVCQDCGYHHHLQRTPLRACPRCGGEQLEVLRHLDPGLLLASLPDLPAVPQELIN